MGKDHKTTARAWLDGVFGVSGLDKIEALAELLSATYQEGWRDAREVEAIETRARPSRKDEELTRRTLQILGSDRTYDALRRMPHKRRAVAQHAKVEVDVLRAFLDGLSAGPVTNAAIMKSFRELGIDDGEGERETGNDDE